MSEMLSQDEIDALLRGTSDNTPTPEVEAKEEHLDSMESDALGEIGNISFGNSATALSTLLQQKVEITTPVVSEVRIEALRERYPTPHVALRVGYTEGIQGENVLVLTREDAAIISDLMLGGSGENVDPESLDEIRLSAVQEAMNQMMGAAATSLSTVFSKKIDISPPLVEVFDATKNQTIIDRLELWETMVLIEFNLKVGTLIDSTIVQIAPIQFGKQLVDELMKATGEVQAASEPVKEQPKAEAPKPQPQAQQPAQSVAPQPNKQKSMPEVAVSQAEFMPLQSPASQETAPANLGLLYDVPLNVTVELGRTKKSVREVLELSQGSIIELDKLAGEPVDIYVNQQRIARGEVVVIEENFGVRVTEIIQPHERIGIV
ncbi:flagellar motor switch phosphatase FliY [Exiguobacterium profundum]|uniref:flagellar motor switch phosphatase FliY n=1 Tax=Exiguobacterium TaxID=33986 RepID=UPI0012F1F10A|nr:MULTISPECIES: flagellar motor switch phosphatase FliY [Exiguobacterium]QPI66624.1 flagellar motor switch phosphatase FliY [Exiguobacterium sp. PBE]MBG0916740.1 flagellar motor switch phosphatase FliY [Exiguobacterium sp. SRB7LM]MCT4798601.1 flagellar motor switch phosphatase FliY [Exiguobacterium profundum]VXB08428.1 flagellar motor switching and energizing phosphatase [Exiguobacterium sp. 8A]VXB08504.1 flagellar motor switching and energizing phosphatase [Exiguobacterium sp. 8H]